MIGKKILSALGAVVLIIGMVVSTSGSVQAQDMMCVDHDGDGWGWDGSKSCRIQGFVPTGGACVDSDGDGWGWDGVRSCRPDASDNDAETPNNQAPNTEATGTLAQTVANASNFSILNTALQLTGLDAVLADPSASYTVFAPNDQAFALLGEDTINALINDPETLTNILLTHVVVGAVDAKTALGLSGSTADNAAGTKLGISINDGSLYVNTSKVIATDIAADNGIVHVLDRVILPRSTTHAAGSIVDVAVENGQFNTLVTALQATGLDALLQDTSTTFTVFAPTDDAFAALGADTIAALLSDLDTLSGILATHVIVGAAVDSTTALSLTGGTVETASGAAVELSIRGHELFVNNSQVIVADIVTDNGVIHVIDAVIQPH